MKYDVAFSLLSEDEPIAQNIQAHFPLTVSSFLYTSRQRELISHSDGLNAFPEVFRDARLCVVLYRSGWGRTRWTRLEERTIGDRYMDDGTSFLLFARLDRSTDLPRWVPTQAFWVDYQAEGAERVADYIISRLNRLEEGISRRTSRTFARQPIPIARYQAYLAQQTRAWTEHVPIEPEICDGCTAAVQFRPIVVVGLPSYEGLPAATERLCPTCARNRGIRVYPPPGLSPEALFASANPTFRDYVIGRFSHWVLRALSANPTLCALGVTNVGAMMAAPWIILIASIEGRPDLKLSLSIDDLRRDKVRSDPELLEYSRLRLEGAIRATVDASDAVNGSQP